MPPKAVPRNRRSQNSSQDYIPIYGRLSFIKTLYLTKMEKKLIETYQERWQPWLKTMSNHWRRASLYSR